VIQSLIDWGFEDHEGWPGLQRLTIEIPAPFKALVKHASRRLGFGGRFKHEGVFVEGVKQNASRWKGRLVDVLVLGLQAPAHQKSTQDVEPVEAQAPVETLPT
jgi:hypothetical protein